MCNRTQTVDVSIIEYRPVYCETGLLMIDRPIGHGPSILYSTLLQLWTKMGVSLVPVMPLSDSLKGRNV